MLEFIRELFRGESLLDQAYEDTVTVLRIARDMTAAASDSLRRSRGANPALEVFKTDIHINKYERETRRKVVTHMAISTSADLAPALILTSIVIDVERIGDYAKNIVELAVVHPEPLQPVEYEGRLEQLEERVRLGFDRVSAALRESNEAQARDFMATHGRYSQMADAIVKEVILGKDSLEKTDAAALVLYAR